MTLADLVLHTGEWGLAGFLIGIIVIAAAIAIAIIALKYFGVTIPPVVVQIFWIVLVAVVAIIAIKIILAA